MMDIIGEKLNVIITAIHALKVYTSDNQNPEFRETVQAFSRITETVEDIENLILKQKDLNEKYQNITRDIHTLTQDIDNELLKYPDFEEPTQEEIEAINEETRRNCGGFNYELTPAELDSNKSNKTPRKPSVFIMDIDHLTQEDVNSIPKYMLGRTTMEAINQFIDVINIALEKKYTLLRKKKSAMKSKEMKLYTQYTVDELPELKGKTYISGKNISDVLGNSSLDKKALNMITILRHMKRILDYRSGSTKVFVVT